MKTWKVTKWQYVNRARRTGQSNQGEWTGDAENKKQAIGKACASGLAGGDWYTASPTKKA